MKAEMTAQFVTDALFMAIWRRGNPVLIFILRRLQHRQTNWGA